MGQSVLINNMAIFGRNKITVGLDIGSGLIKAAVIDHGSGSPELVRVAMTSLASDAIVDGEIMDPELVGQGIRSTLEKAGVNRKEVVAAVGGRDVMIKRIQTERVRKSQAYELIRLEAEQHVPNFETVEIDFQILGHNEFDDEMTVLFAAAKRDLIDTRVRVLQDVGLEPVIMDVESFALHNAFQYNYPEAMNGGVALVNIGHESMGVNILDDGVPILTRDSSLGTRRFKEDMQREFGMSAEDAEETIRHHEQSPALDSILEYRSEEISSVIERSATFLGTYGKRSTDVSTVYLCGGGSRTPGLAAMIAERLNRPVRLANPLERLTVRNDAFGSWNADDIHMLLMVPVGLALRQEK